ncbi:stage II sporulation protein E [Anaerohalosphaera lusitana]|uniref:Stage II sporulation protein E n=1 Tax=Anaerohalosphaera lusitana TaxID=1936003 RepID=A0A1U9NMB8_9BACT|nr:SpoIIE family protein phosphatase [Anaerohalosphaera lusitana]AQT68975.1 stage II sporulation protein E [Anaerohalosphaera lusitana]
MQTDKAFVEVDFGQHSKSGQQAAGDVFLSKKIPEEGRTICVLADGLGSGIKAHVLATLTATMAMKYISSDIDIRRASEIIMATLPICSERKIGYSTFTIVDIRSDGRVSVIEYDNPPFRLLRDGVLVDIDKKKLEVATANRGRCEVLYSSFTARQGDRTVFYTDGVTQSGMGRDATPFGWGNDAVGSYIVEQCGMERDISARQLSRSVVEKARRIDGGKAKDDISCAVVNFRRPRKSVVMTGPPLDERKDTEMARILREYGGRKIVCGGTTARIIARELGEEISVDLGCLDSSVPPASNIAGVDLVTEGTLTLSRMAEILEAGEDPDKLKSNAAVRLARYLLDSDIIEFVVGTKINEAHQDPNFPVELDIRRNLMKRIVGLLNTKYLKQANMRLI